MEIMELDETLGYTVIYFPNGDPNSIPVIAGRFKTTKEKDIFLEKLVSEKSKLKESEKRMIIVVNDYDYKIPYRIRR